MDTVSPWRFRTPRKVLERLADRETHRLLLKGQAQLVAQRAVEVLGRGSQRSSETEAGFDCHYEEVDQVWQATFYLVEADPCSPSDEHKRKHPSPRHHEQRK